MAPKKTKKKVSKKTPKKVARKTPKKIARKIPKKAFKKTTKKVARKTVKKVPKKKPEKVAPKKIKKVKTTKVKITKPEKGKLIKEKEDERKAALRRSLIQKREEIVKEAKSEISKYIKGETRQLVDTALDDGDWSVVDLTEDISLRQLSTHRENLLKIDEALRKLEESTYGRCEDCGEEISEQRLKIVPFATRCRDCQERREQLTELEKGGVIK